MVNGQWSILNAPASLAWLCSRHRSLRHLGRPCGEPHQASTGHKGQRPRPARSWWHARPLRQRPAHHPRLRHLLHIDIELDTILPKREKNFKL